MPRILPIDPATAAGDAAAQLAIARQTFGRVPNMFATAAHAPAALEAMLGMFASLGRGALGARLGERIAVAVAQQNGCGYCLAAHTAIGKLHGVPAGELEAARRARSAEPHAAALLALAAAINERRGHVDDSTLAAARAAGVTDAEIVEVVAHVALNVFTNTLNNVAGTAVDFPVVPLESAAA